MKKNPYREYHSIFEEEYFWRKRKTAWHLVRIYGRLYKRRFEERCPSGLRSRSWKPVTRKGPWVRIPPFPPWKFHIGVQNRIDRRTLIAVWRSTQAGRRGAPAKGVGRETGARVRIPPSPPCKSSRFYKREDLFFIVLKQKNAPPATDGVSSLVGGAFCLQISVQKVL